LIAGVAWYYGFDAVHKLGSLTLHQIMSLQEHIGMQLGTGETEDHTDELSRSFAEMTTRTGRKTFALKELI